MKNGLIGLSISIEKSALTRQNEKVIKLSKTTE